MSVPFAYGPLPSLLRAAAQAFMLIPMQKLFNNYLGLSFFLLSLGVMASAQAAPPHSTQIIWRIEGTTPANNQPLMARSGFTSPTIWHIEGLPYPGTVLWRPSTQELAYQHPTEGSWLRATAAEMVGNIPPTLTPAAASQPWQGAPTRRFAVTANGTVCGALFTAKSLGNGLNAADLQTIHALLQWLNSGRVPSGCAAAYPWQASLGLPTRWASPFGPVVLESITQTGPDAPLPVWPEATYPADAEARLRLLLVQLPLPARAAFLREYAVLPTEKQIETLSQALQQAAAEVQ